MLCPALFKASQSRCRPSFGLGGLIETGFQAGKVALSQFGVSIQAQAVINTIFWAWRICLAVNMERNASQLANRIIEQAGGPSSAKKQFEDK